MTPEQLIKEIKRNEMLQDVFYMGAKEMFVKLLLYRNLLDDYCKFVENPNTTEAEIWEYQNNIIKSAIDNL